MSSISENSSFSGIFSGFSSPFCFSDLFIFSVSVIVLWLIYSNINEKIGVFQARVKYYPLQHLFIIFSISEKNKFNMVKVILFSLVFSLGWNFTTQKESIQKSADKNATEKTADTLALDYDTRLGELKKSLGNDFLFVKDSYFLIVSNLTGEETDKIAENTVNKAVACFFNNYFETKPTDVTVIFLFKDDASYRYWAKKLYNDDDLSRFGYYKPGSKTMLMNISTGTGTLVHEMTHAFVRYDFPNIPSWFNEGLGSLYERCSLSNNEILGYVNWRLPRLQEGISDGSYTSLEQLMNTTDDEFYGDKSDFNYSQARYLCMYMQEKGLLKKFYKSFRDGYTNDKTGISTIEKTFGKDLKSIEKDYLDWVKTLKYE
jgi:hypothetical protein